MWSKPWFVAVFRHSVTSPSFPDTAACWRQITRRNVTGPFLCHPGLGSFAGWRCWCFYGAVRVSVVFVVTFRATQSKIKNKKWNTETRSASSALLPSKPLSSPPLEVHWHACPRLLRGHTEEIVLMLLGWLSSQTGPSAPSSSCREAPGSRTGGVCHNARKFGKCPFSLESKSGLKSSRHFSTERPGSRWIIEGSVPVILCVTSRPCSEIFPL